MTKETEQIAKKINELRSKKKEDLSGKKVSGYQIITEVIVNLLGCVLIGASLGIIFQNLFGTSVKLTVALIFLGGIAGIWSTIKYIMGIEANEDSE